jgi:hypothetical protein
LAQARVDGGLNTSLLPCDGDGSILELDTLVMHRTARVCGMQDPSRGGLYESIYIGSTTRAPANTSEVESLLQSEA